MPQRLARPPHATSPPPRSARRTPSRRSRRWCGSRRVPGGRSSCVPTDGAGSPSGSPRPRWTCAWAAAGAARALPVAAGAVHPPGGRRARRRGGGAGAYGAGARAGAEPRPRQRLAAPGLLAGRPPSADRTTASRRHRSTRPGSTCTWTPRGGSRSARTSPAFVCRAQRKTEFESDRQMHTRGRRL